MAQTAFDWTPRFYEHHRVPTLSVLQNETFQADEIVQFVWPLQCNTTNVTIEDCKINAEGQKLLLVLTMLSVLKLSFFSEKVIILKWWLYSFKMGIENKTYWHFQWKLESTKINRSFFTKELYQNDFWNNVNQYICDANGSSILNTNPSFECKLKLIPIKRSHEKNTYTQSQAKISY